MPPTIHRTTPSKGLPAKTPRPEHLELWQKGQGRKIKRKPVKAPVQAQR